MQNGLQYEALAGLVNNNKKTLPVILCVDGKLEVLDSLEQLLGGYFDNKYGKIFRILKAEDGYEAMELLEELQQSGRDVPVILFDQILYTKREPRMQGLDFLMNAQELTANTKKIMFTAEPHLPEIRNAIMSGALVRYFEKPFDPTELKLAVEEAASNYFRQKAATL